MIVGINILPFGVFWTISMVYTDAPRRPSEGNCQRPTFRIVANQEACSLSWGLAFVELGLNSTQRSVVDICNDGSFFQSAVVKVKNEEPLHNRMMLNTPFVDRVDFVL